MLIGAYSLNSYSSFAENNYRVLVQETNYVEQDPIIVLNDETFIDYGFPGSGTDTDPYIIDGFNITTEEDYGIKVRDTTKYFVIQNCYVDSGYYGISVSSVAAGTALIQDNICVNGNDGIIVSSSDSAKIYNNYLANNHRYSIWISQASNLVVDSNTCVNNSALRIAFDITDCIVSNNELFNEGLSIFDNNVNNLHTYNLINNLVNDKILGYFYNLQDVVFNTPIYGQLYLVSCKEIEIYNQNLDDTYAGMVLRNCEDSYVHHISCVNGGINVYESTRIKISNTLCSNGGGINCEKSNYTEITKNICTNAAGIYLRYLDRVLVEENICSQSAIGIDVSWSHYVNITRNECKGNWAGINIGASNYAFISQNYCLDNTNGIYVLGNNAVIENNICSRNCAPEDYSYYYMDLQGFGIIARGKYNLQIINNNCSENTHGIGVSWAVNGLISHNFCSKNEVGLLLAASKNYDVSNNSFWENDQQGIKMIGFPGDVWWGQSNATSNEIIFNNIGYNTHYGITLDALTNQNLIQYNNFIHNSLLLNSQAEDNGTENTWSFNFWSDLEGSSYSIDGSANSEDSSPLSEPLVINNEEISIPPITTPTVTIEKSTFHFGIISLFFLCLVLVRLRYIKRIKRLK